MKKLKMKKLTILNLSICAVSIALHIVLEVFCTIRIGNDLKITLSALPFIITAFLCGPLEGMITGAVGAFLSQLLTFGVTATTPLWILPYAVQGLLSGIIYRYAFKQKVKLVPMGVSVFASGIVSVVLTWCASWLDGVVIYKYMILEALIALIPIRLLVWAAVSAVYTAVSYPVVKALLKSKII